MKRRRTRLVFDRTMVAVLAGALILLQLLLFTAGFLVGATGEVRALTPLPPSPSPAFGRPNPSPREGGVIRLASSVLARVEGALSRAAGEGRGGGLSQTQACAIPVAALAPKPRPRPAPMAVFARLPAKPRPSPLVSFLEPPPRPDEPPPPPRPPVAKPILVRYVAKPALSAIAYAAMIRKAAERHEISPALVEAVIRVESSFNPRAVSHKGARGLMQLMPATGRRFGVRSDRLFDPEHNLSAGTAYLAWLSKRYRGNLDFILAAYNAGEGAVDDHGGIPPYRETRDYVRKVRSALRSIEEALSADKEAAVIPTPQVVVEDVLRKGKAIAAPAVAEQAELGRGVAQLQFPPALAGDQKARTGLSAGERAGAREGVDRTGAGGG